MKRPCSLFLWCLLLIVLPLLTLAQDSARLKKQFNAKIRITYYTGRAKPVEKPLWQEMSDSAVSKETVTYLKHGGQKHQIETRWDDPPNNDDIRIDRATKLNDNETLAILNLTAKKDIVLDELSIIIPESMDSVHSVFCNGFQSWTTSREYKLDEKIPRIGPVLNAVMGYYGDYKFTNYPAKKGQLHSWAYTYLKKDNGEIVLTGSVSEYSGYTLLMHDTRNGTLTVSKDCKGLELKAGASLEGLRLYIIKGGEDAVFDKYTARYTELLKRTASHHNIKLAESTAPPALGWTSWYNYFNKISQDTILGNLRNFRAKNIPIDMFQIDDGWQLSTGDWLHVNTHFPGGMKLIADSVHASGYMAGLWLAPFICEKKSVIFEQHKNWLLKNKKGKPIIVGINPLWSGNYYALDIYNPQVRSYLKNVFDTVLRNWGYDMVKLDFLFAAAIQPPKNKTRGQVMFDAMLLLRELVGPDKYIDGCGAPMASAFKLVDYCRISSDVHTNWEQLILKALKVRERLSVWNSLTSAIGRRQLAGRMFLNDPDVFMLRKERTHLKPEQEYTMFLADNLFGKLNFTSDNIGNYDSSRLARYRSAFPLSKKEHLSVIKNGDVYEVAFEVHGRPYYAVINLSGKTQAIKMDSNTWFNNATDTFVKANSSLVLKPYQSVCLYRLSGKPFDILGGGNSLFSGSEIDSFQLANGHLLQMYFREGYGNKGEVVIKVPAGFDDLMVNGKPVKPVDINGIHCLLYKP